MNEVELHPWHTEAGRQALWNERESDQRAEPDLRAMLEEPGSEARLRATLEPELGTGLDLSGEALIDSTLDRLDQGRLVIQPRPWPSVPVDPHYPVNDGVEDLGNLVDLLDDPPDEDDGQEPSPAEPPRPTWIEITVVDGHGEPIVGRPYRLHLPDGSVRNGHLGDDGMIRFDDVDPGLCTLELPTDDPAEWAPPGALAA